MHVEHQGATPTVHPSAWVAPTAVLSGDVTVGPEARVLHGAILAADGGPVSVGARSVVMENAVVRGSGRHPAWIGEDVLVGPRAYLTGCTVGDAVFLATGTTVFNGATLGTGAEVRVNGVVHLRTRLEPGAVVPIGWVAVGDPASILAPDRHDEIWALQEPLDFPGEVFGLERGDDPVALQRAMMERYSRGLGRHRDDRVL